MMLKLIAAHGAAMILSLILSAYFGCGGMALSQPRTKGAAIIAFILALTFAVFSIAQWYI